MGAISLYSTILTKKEVHMRSYEKFAVAVVALVLFMILATIKAATG